MSTTTVRRRPLELPELIDRHPLRPAILEAIPRLELEVGAPGVSPVELADDLGQPLGRVAYHVRVLANVRALELVEERRVRGAVEHRYTVTARGAGALEANPLEVAVQALEGIAWLVRNEDLEDAAAAAGALVLAERALERLGRRVPSSVSA
jgi:predicted ArsR family transcriptional regulator